MPNYGQIPDCYHQAPNHRAVLTVTHHKLAAIAPDYYLVEIKEKYGALRIEASAPALEDVEWDNLESAAQLSGKLETITAAAEDVADGAHTLYADKAAQAQHDAAVAEILAELSDSPT